MDANSLQSRIENLAPNVSYSHRFAGQLNEYENIKYIYGAKWKLRTDYSFTTLKASPASLPILIKYIPLENPFISTVVLSAIIAPVNISFPVKS